MEPEKRHTYFVLMGLLSFLCIYTVIPHSRLIDSVTLLFDQRYYYDKVFRDTEVKNDSASSQNMIAESSTNTGGAYKKMLIWTKWNSEQLAYDQHNQPGWFKNCPESRCLAVTNRNERKQASAIIFYMPDFNPKDLPHQSARNRSVYYIFHLDESPDTTKKLMNYRAWDNHPGFFNLTMSYRLDSDIYPIYTPEDTRLVILINP
ncbi:uncharacterized protein LOC129600420 [Paramacrobiotus metropolitanus]|uniref:uncharacterized protein LOC129600420 n=1 Tax=Paramacrobiotus metropolitanus TaxID=2943436 RepID=UPI002445DEC1|nr:uncharacterized protein LOC129600420 [Paramacrobiotus metropolitanus]